MEINEEGGEEVANVLASLHVKFRNHSLPACLLLAWERCANTLSIFTEPITLPHTHKQTQG
jgi:hypothetical protein